VTNSSNNDDNDTDSSSIWRSLCINYFQEDENVVSSILEATNLSARRSFSSSVAPELYTSPTEIQPHQCRPPLKYSPRDYVLVVQVWGKPNDNISHNTDKFLFCKTLQGEKIPEVFESGRCSVTLSQPLMMFLGMRFKELKAICWKTKIRMVRKPDGKIVELCEIERSGYWIV
jgi:hypothetical protein